MTTKVFIVNFGPDPVEVRRGTDPIQVFQPGAFFEAHLWADGNITLVEKKLEATQETI